MSESLSKSLMTLSSFSDVIVSVTLIVNAIALTHNPPPAGAVKEPLDAENAPLLEHDMGTKSEEALTIGIFFYCWK